MARRPDSEWRSNPDPEASPELLVGSAAAVTALLDFAGGIAVALFTLAVLAMGWSVLRTIRERPGSP